MKSRVHDSECPEAPSTPEPTEAEVTEQAGLFAGYEAAAATDGQGEQSQQPQPVDLDDAPTMDAPWQTLTALRRQSMDADLATDSDVDASHDDTPTLQTPVSRQAALCMASRPIGALHAPGPGHAAPPVAFIRNARLWWRSAVRAVRQHWIPAAACGAAAIAAGSIGAGSTSDANAAKHLADKASRSTAHAPRRGTATATQTVKGRPSDNARPVALADSNGTIAASVDVVNFEEMLADGPLAALMSEPKKRSYDERRWRRALARAQRELEAGNFEPAVWSFERATQYNPDDPDAYAGLGDALREAGSTRRAIRAYEIALEIDSKHKGAREGERRALMQRIERLTPDDERPTFARGVRFRLPASGALAARSDCECPPQAVASVEQDPPPSSQPQLPPATTEPRPATRTARTQAAPERARLSKHPSQGDEGARRAKVLQHASGFRTTF